MCGWWGGVWGLEVWVVGGFGGWGFGVGSGSGGGGSDDSETACLSRRVPTYN